MKGYFNVGPLPARRVTNVDGLQCIYCGDSAEHRDHVIPYSYDNVSEKRSYSDYSEEKVVPSCRECNCMLSDQYIPEICRRAGYLAIRIKTKYKKLLRFADIQEWEEDELQPSTVKHIKFLMRLRDYTNERVSYCELTATMECLTPKEYWRSHHEKLTDGVDVVIH